MHAAPASRGDFCLVPLRQSQQPQLPYITRILSMISLIGMLNSRNFQTFSLAIAFLAKYTIDMNLVL